MDNKQRMLDASMVNAAKMEMMEISTRSLMSVGPSGFLRICPLQIPC